MVQLKGKDGIIDTHSSNVFQLPYFYLKHGDVMYDEPNSVISNTAAVDGTRDLYLTYIKTGMAIFLSVYNIILNSQR